MIRISYILRITVIITLFFTIVYGISNSKNFDPLEQTIKVIEDCIASTPAPWSDLFGME